jgi:hypothetical protein
MKPEDPAYLHHILDASIEDFSRGISSAAELNKPGVPGSARLHGTFRRTCVVNIGFAKPLIFSGCERDPVAGMKTGPGRQNK